MEEIADYSGKIASQTTDKKTSKETSTDQFLQVNRTYLQNLYRDLRVNENFQNIE